MAYFRFDPRTQEREAVSVYAAGGEEAVTMMGGQAATLLLQHLKQVPMPIIESPITCPSKFNHLARSHPSQMSNMG